MNRRLIWIIAGVSVLGLGVPAFAAARGGDGTPEDNGVPGDVRGNCDEAEHANDPECLAADPSTTTIVVTVPATLPATTAPETSVPDSSVAGQQRPRHVDAGQQRPRQQRPGQQRPGCVDAGQHGGRHQWPLRRSRACQRSSLHRCPAGGQLRTGQPRRRWRRRRQLRRHGGARRRWRRRPFRPRWRRRQRATTTTPGTVATTTD